MTKSRIAFAMLGTMTGLYLTYTLWMRKTPQFPITLFMFGNDTNTTSHSSAVLNWDKVMTPTISIRCDVSSNARHTSCGTTGLPTANITNRHHIPNQYGNITVVTAFFHMGDFSKGAPGHMRKVDSYRRWARPFGYMMNPTVFYTDSEDFEKLFLSLRSNPPFSNMTKIVRVDRSSLWSFQIRDQIQKIYSRPGYPKHYPNTVLSEYASISHSKFAVLPNSIEKDFFNTTYFCWVDLGYFRDIHIRNKTFSLQIPKNFDSNKVAVTEVFGRSMGSYTPRAIILGNMNWVGGGLFLGTPKLLLSFCKDYKRTLMEFIGENLTNVEQHIIFSMYTTEQRKKHPPSVELQTYRLGNHSVIDRDPWFFLGYYMYKEVSQNLTFPKTM